MARDESTDAPRAPEPQETVEQTPTHPVVPDPVVDTRPVAEPADDPQPTFNVSLNPDSELEAPVFVSVPNLHTDVEPLPHPDDIRDADGNFLPGYDDSTVTLVETEDGWQRPESADASEPVVELDEHGRLELGSSPVEVPAVVARVLEDLPYVSIQAVRS